MKTYIYFVCITFIVIVTSCKSTSRQKESSYTDRFNIVIEDYCRKNKNDLKNNNFFSVKYNEMENKGYYFYDILPMRDKSYKYSIDANPERSYLPCDYIKFKGKVFFVEDKKIICVKAGLLEYLNSLQLLDSTTVKLQLGLVKLEDVELIMDRSDDSLEGVTYIICKKEPYTIRKRIRSSSYIPPDDKRFENLCE